MTVHQHCSHHLLGWLVAKQMFRNYSLFQESGNIMFQVQPMVQHLVVFVLIVLNRYVVFQDSK